MKTIVGAAKRGWEGDAACGRRKRDAGATIACARATTVRVAVGRGRHGLRKIVLSLVPEASQFPQHRLHPQSHQSMCGVHTCFRSALTQAFRLSNCTVAAAAACSVPEFLVPAVARQSRRPYAATCRRHDRQAAAQSASQPSQHQLFPTFRSKHVKPPLSSRIPLPLQEDRCNIEQWLAVLEPFLPSHFQRGAALESDVSSDVTPLELAVLLNAAGDAGHDILSHYGLLQHRWEVVIWIAKKIVGDGKQPAGPSAHLDVFTNIIWPKSGPQTLDHFTNAPLMAHRVRQSPENKYTLGEIMDIPDSINARRRAVRQAIGQLWRSLGNFIIAAADDGDNINDSIMSPVLEVIAHFHHIGLIPEAVYAHKAPQDEYALRQPPTLHLLSTQILTALSDASWRAHEASVEVATERLNASYFLGHEIPGSRYKLKITQVVPELWLEFVLWACLHGGWLLDGSAILHKMSSDSKGHGWGLISWRELLRTKGRDLENLNAWSFFRRRDDRSSQAEARKLTRRTISSEVVTAFVDGLVNTMRVGVGSRGIAPEVLVDSIKKLKRFLEVNSLSLGSTTWDTIMARLLESGGIVPEKRPELLLSILDLASAFGTEVSSVNASPLTTEIASEPPYFFEPTAIPLSLLHQTIRAFIRNGDVAGAMQTLRTLQQYTDLNKQKSLEQFFERLKMGTPKGETTSEGEIFASRMPPIEYPAFEHQIPPPLLARLLDLVTESKMYGLGRWLLFADDLDGPIIPPSMYKDWGVAAAIVRFGTLAGETDLVLKIVRKTGTWSDTTQSSRMPYEFLTSMMCSQIKLYRWQSVQGMQQYVLDSPGYRPKPEILASFGSELLRSSASAEETPSSGRSQICQTFTQFLFTWEGLLLAHVRNELYCVLAIISTVDNEWQEYCSQFLTFNSLLPIKLSTADFNQILDGVLDGYGSLKGKEVVERWCYEPPRTFEPYRAPGGLPRMSQYRPSRGEEYEHRPDNIEIVQPSGTKLTLQGRIHPNRQTIWAVLRSVEHEEQLLRRGGEELPVAKRAEFRGTLKWAARLLYYLGFDYEDIIRDFGGLAELAELEAPRASDMLRLPEVEEEVEELNP